jgi:hypothetical protein
VGKWRHSHAARELKALFKSPQAPWPKYKKYKQREREKKIRGRKSMGSRELKRAALNEKLQQLRAATNSSAVITIYQYLKHLL